MPAGSKGNQTGGLSGSAKVPIWLKRRAVPTSGVDQRFRKKQVSANDPRGSDLDSTRPMRRCIGRSSQNMTLRIETKIMATANTTGAYAHQLELGLNSRGASVATTSDVVNSCGDTFHGRLVLSYQRPWNSKLHSQNRRRPDNPVRWWRLGAPVR